MSKLQSHEHVEMIPMDQIVVLNPRARNQRHHREIVENIRAIGLKRPITVSRHNLPDGSSRYHLVCGQGRLEAFQLLKQKEIPAFVMDASEDDCLIMSLVENVARRQHRAIDLMREIGELRARGRSDVQIAEQIGVTASWVNMIGGLLDKGEERLLAAVETGLIPLSMATDIARGTEAEVREMLLDAYEQGFRGKKLSSLRRLLEQRLKRRKTIDTPPPGVKAKRRKLTVQELRRIYEREAEKQRLMAKKAAFTHERLVFATEALKELSADRKFAELLRTEGLHSMPKVLKDRIAEARTS
ncbi:MAG TPA: plasmid partitioning protein RepB C-terminal domain-containing protein [Nevskia sp.]|nr:plasmid partitioning protein RepB C-terminal domain-containing protein [Nevskia sp.]